ncbi:MAG: DUF1592 domain-containing protein [Myxococcota bacterium]
MARWTPLTLLLACTGTFDTSLTAEQATVPMPDEVALPNGDVCSPADIVPPERQLARLTRDELQRAAEDLLGVDASGFQNLSADSEVAGFLANTQTSIDRTFLQTLFNVTEELSADAVRNGLGPCSGGGCAEAFVDDFGMRAYRRPLTAEDRTELLTLYESAERSWGPDRAMEMTVQSALLSPEFLYHVVLGDGTSVNGSLVAGPYELASALSFFLWRTMPDEELFAVAKAGELSTPLEVEVQVRRMIDDPKVSVVVESFYSQWLHLGEEEVRRDRDLFPEWNDAAAAAVRTETMKYVEEVTFGGSSDFRTLMTGAFTFGDEALAELYGAEAPDANGRIELDPAERAGLLTQASFLVHNAYPDQNSWVHRGLFVRERLFCQALRSPPPGVDDSATNNPDRLVDSACVGCHRQIDPIGIGFENYAPTGAFRTIDVDGTPIDARGSIAGAARLDVPEEFDGAVELAHQLADSEAVQGCFAEQWLRFATRSAEIDPCERGLLNEAFSQTGGDLRELMVLITLSKTFGHRRIEVSE